MGYYSLRQHYPHSGGGHWVWPPREVHAGRFLPAAPRRGALHTQPHVLLSWWNFQVLPHQSILPFKPVSS